MSAEDVYLEWFKNFLTISCMAEYFGVSEKELEDKINKGKEIHNKKHNE